MQVYVIIWIFREGKTLTRKLNTIKLDNYKPLREVVFEALREAIITGDLKPGERLMELQLAEEMGVSRTPVREAIRKLELEGLVVMVPRKGAYVAGLSLKDAAEVFEIRGSLEGLAASLAAERITEEEMEELERLLVQTKECIKKKDVETLVEKDLEFHDIIYNASRNSKLISILYNLREQFHRFRITSLTGNPERLKDIFEEHERIVEAICSRNSELAKELIQEHIENVESNIMHTLKERTD
ncbi:GntR family transcriptional regulator [Koleobacter methoxysyntrophicus]|uniref:GntR family transcriptional regulator n=1 Tax=Koleobacter methoxysyntrophicus TaxID=2751313 RepID=UPI003BAF8C91